MNVCAVCTTAPFTVTDKLGVIGGITKESASVERAMFDFSCWLDDGEVVGLVSRFSLSIAPSGLEAPLFSSGNWQIDYGFAPVASSRSFALTGLAVPGQWEQGYGVHEGARRPNTRSNTRPNTRPNTRTTVDPTPLVLTGATIDRGTLVNVLVGAGAPGVTYLVSFIAIATLSGREKQVDFLVTIPAMVNPYMLSSLDPAQSVAFTTVGGTTTLPVGTYGTVFVENGSNAPITITLPPAPATGQMLTIVDALGNAKLYNITIVGYGGVMILGDPEYVLAVNHQSGVFQWDGVEWIVH